MEIDSAESEFFVGDGAMMGSGESGLFIGEGDRGSDSLCRTLDCSLGVTAANISLIEGRVSCSATSNVEGSVMSPS